jgi:two-component system, NarL family, invasion response regulator UvrY
MIRILIADDHKLFRRGLRQTIEDAEGMKVEDEASSGNEVLNKIAQKSYDVVILDISMPGANGLDILKQIKASHPGTAVLMLSMHPEEQFAVRAFKAGASGYLTKESDENIILQAIAKISTGGKYISPELGEKLAEAMWSDPRRALHESLSDREFEVFRMIAEGKSLSEIAQILNLGTTTISTYRGRILEKTGLKNNAEITRYAIEHHLID